MSKRRRKPKLRSWLILFGGLAIISLIIINPLKKEEVIEPKFVYEGKNINEVSDYAKLHNLEIESNYSYNDLDKDIIISAIEKDNKLILEVSNGPIGEEVYQEYHVDELGRIPIMMYHGIVNTTDNKYTGGNVDKDGYNRTSNAFRGDLEFYYTSGYRMVRLVDYANGIINVPLGYSPIVLTFDDGNKNNFNVLGRNDDGSLIIDPECAVGILEEFKKKYPDFNVTATFFVMSDLFNQKEYNEEILNWLIDNGYDIGNHTTTHPDFTTISTSKTQEVVGKMYEKLDELLPSKYVKAIALPYGSPYNKTHANFKYILNGNYNGSDYNTEILLRVGWESEVSPFNKSFDKTFLKRCRAYDNNGKEFDIKMVFNTLKTSRYISDGDVNKIVIPSKKESNLNKNIEDVIIYEEA